jgi:AraC-like DNA-binding protein
MQGDVAMRTLYLAPMWSDTLLEEVTALEVSPLLRELILYIHDLDMLQDGVGTHDRLAKVLVDLIADAPAGKLFLSMPTDSRASSAAEWIQANPGSRLELSIVAQQHGCSLRTLQRLFVKETGLTLEAWRQKTRLIFSVSLLSSGTNVTQAALMCGYDSLSAFIAVFKRQFGVTPGRYIDDPV